MHWLFLSPLLIAAAISLSLAAVVWRRRPTQGAIAFTVLMLALTIWSLCYFFAILNPTLDGKAFWSRAAYLGIVIVPGAWLVMALEHSNHTRWIKPKYLSWLALEPLLTLVIVWSSPLRHLIWQEVELASRDTFNNLQITHGPLFQVHTAYSYLLLFIGTILLIYSASRSPRLYRGQSLALLIGALVPWAGNVLYVFNIPPFNQIDLTPFFFAFTSPILALGLFRFGLLDFLPLAYDTVIESMPDGMVVLDNQNRVAAINQAAELLTGCRAKQALGQPAGQVFVSWPEFSQRQPSQVSASFEVAKGEGKDKRFYELLISPLYDKNRQISGQTVVIHESTEHKKVEQALRETLAETEALYRVSRLSIASTSLPSILQAAVDSVAEALPADRVSLVSFDFEGKKIINFVKGGPGASQIQFEKPEELSFDALMEGGSGRAIRELKPILISKGKDANYQPTGQPQGAIIIAPLLYREQLLGTLTASNRIDQPDFSPRDEELTMAIASQAAAAIENARLLQAERRQREQADTLRQVASRLNTSLDRQQVLQIILDQLAHIIAFDSASVMLLEENHLSIVAHKNFRSEAQLLATLQLNKLPHIEEVLVKRRPIIISDTASDPRWKPIKESSYIHCWLGVPLVIKDQVIGLLNLDKQEPGFYTEQDGELAVALANQAAIAIENARLFEASQHRAQEAETLRQATAAVIGTLNLDEALDRILVQLESVVPYDSASVQLLHSEYLEIVGGRGWHSPEHVLGLQFPVPGDNPNTIVVQEGRPFILGDTKAAYSLFNQGVHDSILSWLGVPLIVHDVVIGMLALDSKHLNYYQESHARLAAAFADQVAIAIENARLYAAEQQRVQEAEALRATLADISAELELPKLLKAILERATAMINAAGGDLGLYDETRQEILIVTSHNMGKDYAGTRLKMGEGLMGRVAESLQPLLIEDYSRWEGRSPQYLEGSWHSVMAVPLLIGGSLAGIIGIVTSESKRVFTASDQRLLNLFAQQASIAVANARLYQSAREAAERRAVLHEVSQEIVAASLDPEAIYIAVHRATEKLMPAEAFAITLVNENHNLNDAVYLIDRSGRVVGQAFPADQGITGIVINSGEALYIPDLLESREQINSIHFGDPEEVRSILAVPMRLGRKVIGTLSAQSYQPHSYSSEDQHLLEMLASYAAVALDNARLFGEVQRLAIIDPFIDIYNRRHLFEMGQREFMRARRFKRPLSAILLDIDHFKKVNDTYGHAAGDEVLLLLAKLIEENIREIDLFGRYGGEEFTILLPETSIQEAYLVAERLRRQVEQRLAVAQFGPVNITVSIGVASTTEDMPDLAALVARADQAMYDAKKAGRNRVATR